MGFPPPLLASPPPTPPPLISQPAPRARLCGPIYKFCAHVAEWSGVYCRGTLTVMRPHVSEPFFFFFFFLRFTPTLETRIWPCLHPLRKSSPPRCARALSSVSRGESETRNKVCVRMRADVSPVGWRGNLDTYGALLQHRFLFFFPSPLGSSRFSVEFLSPPLPLFPLRQHKKKREKKSKRLDPNRTTVCGSVLHVCVWAEWVKTA